MRILLATDVSEYSEAVVDEIAWRPLPKGTEVRILSVLSCQLFPLRCRGQEWISKTKFKTGAGYGPRGR